MDLVYFCFAKNAIRVHDSSILDVETVLRSWPYTSFIANLCCLTLCILMHFLIHIDTISMGLTIAYFRGRMYGKNFLNCDVFLSLKVVLNLVNSEDPDEMQHYAAFHLGLHCFA